MAAPTKERGVQSATWRGPVNHVHVIGGGPIGMSLALDLKFAHVKVTMHEPDYAKAQYARRQGIPAIAAYGYPDVVMVTTPSSELESMIERWKDVPLVVSVAEDLKHPHSLMTRITTSSGAANVMLATHPVVDTKDAKRNLFHRNQWTVAPVIPSYREGDEAYYQMVLWGIQWLDRMFGARTVMTTPKEHDEAMAVARHLPKVLNATLAHSAHGAGSTSMVSTLAGPRTNGALSASRAGHPGLREALSTNRLTMISALDRTISDLTDLKNALEDGDGEDTVDQRIARWIDHI